MYPCPIRMRAQSFHNFSRKAILKLQDQLSQHDRCKNLNQRHLRYARRFKSTNQHITTVGSSKPQPCPAQGCLFGHDTLIGGFESTRIPQIPLVEIFALVETFFRAYFKCLWLRFLHRLKLSWNFYWKICFQFCILEQIIATILFICFSSVNNKRSLLRFQSTTAPTNRGWSACDTSRFDMNSSSEITQKFGLLQINFAAEREKHFGWIFFVL